MPEVHVEPEYDELGALAGADHADHDRLDGTGPGFDAEMLEIQTGAMRVAATFEPPMLSIDGDVDASVLPALVGTLAKVTHHGSGDVRVDLGRLRRVDVGGLRALFSSAGNLHSDGRRLVLHAVAPWLLGLLIVTGWDDAPGLRLATGPVPTR